MAFDPEKTQKQIESLTNLIGSIIPAVAAGTAIIKLIAKAVRPSDAKKAQEFDAAMAEVKQHQAALGSSLEEFERIKAEILSSSDAGNASAPLSSATASSGQALNTTAVPGATTESASALVGKAPDASGDGQQTEGPK